MHLASLSVLPVLKSLVSCCATIVRVSTAGCIASPIAPGFYEQSGRGRNQSARKNALVENLRCVHGAPQPEALAREVVIFDKRGIEFLPQHTLLLPQSLPLLGRILRRHAGQLFEDSPCPPPNERPLAEHPQEHRRSEEDDEPNEGGAERRRV